MVMSLESKSGWHSSTVYTTLWSGLAGLREAEGRLALSAPSVGGPLPSTQSGTQERGLGPCTSTAPLLLEAAGTTTMVPGALLHGRK